MADLGAAIAHLAPGPDRCIDDGPIHVGMVRGWAGTESDEPSSRNWAGNLRPRACAGDWRLVCVLERERESEKQNAIESDGKSFTQGATFLYMNGTRSWSANS